MILRRRRKPFTRIFFATDLHGSNRTFRKFLNAAKVYEPQVLIIGGDVTGKALVPIVERGDGTYEVGLHGMQQTLTGEQQLQDLREAVETQGHYHFVTSPEGYARLRDDQGAQDQMFLRLVRERLQEWRQLAEERLGPLGLRCFVTGGNDDDVEALAPLDEADGALSFCEGRPVMIDDHHAMVSCGWSNRTPWCTPRELSEDELEGRLLEAVDGIDDFANCIFNFHVPPYDSTLDLCPKLDASTDPPTPVFAGGQMVMDAAGSTAVRAMIERFQPLLGLHGHIHEARGVMTIGRSTCVNPGSEYGEGFLRGCLVNLADGEVLGCQMTSG